VPTENLEAYENYVKGKMLFYEQAEFYKSIQYFKKAIELDPEFFHAYEYLFILHSAFFNHNRPLDTQEHKKAAKFYLDKIYQLGMDPNPHSLGWYKYRIERDFTAAKKLFLKAIEEFPNDPDTYKTFGNLLLEEGSEESIIYYQKSLELDPNTAWRYSNLIHSYRMFRLWDQANEISDRYIERFPDEPNAIEHRVWIEIESNGDLLHANKLLNSLSENVNPVDLYSIRESIATYDRNFDEALIIIEKAGWKPFLRKAELYQQLNLDQLYKTYLDSARVKYENDIMHQSQNSNAHAQLGIVYAHLGRREEALVEGKIGMELWPHNKYKLKGAAKLFYMARIHILLENYEPALDLIEILILTPSPYQKNDFKLNFRFDPLKEHPRYQKLMANK